MLVVVDGCADAQSADQAYATGIFHAIKIKGSAISKIFSVARLALLGGTDESVCPYTGIVLVAPGFAQAWTADCGCRHVSKKSRRSLLRGGRLSPRGV
jgi:hypothetical protein